MDTLPLLKLVLGEFFGKATAFVDMIAEHIPSPIAAARTKVEQTYTGPLDSPVGKSMIACNPKGPLMVHVTKLYSKPDCTTFDCLARVMSGTLKVGDNVKVLGENYSLDDEEDMTVKDVTKLWLAEARYRIEIISTRWNMGSDRRCG